jgi:thiol:disulfide interchange protein DsbA
MLSPMLRRTFRHAAALALLCLLPLLAAGAQAPSAPVEGQDYLLIATPQRWQPADGKIEVAEVFAYSCGHCAHFQPSVDTWLRKLPKDVRFSYVPAAYEQSDPYARAFFASQSLGQLRRTHEATFKALHEAFTLPLRNASSGEIETFYASLGVDAGRLREAMASPATDRLMAQARAFQVNAGIQGTPSVIVNGKYLVRGRSFDDILRITDQLIVRERAAGR